MALVPESDIGLELSEAGSEAEVLYCNIENTEAQHSD